MAACQLVLDVCGSDCLSMTDNKGRTPLHLAALCGHAEIVNFLLDQGGMYSSIVTSGYGVCFIRNSLDSNKTGHLPVT